MRSVHLSRLQANQAGPKANRKTDHFRADLRCPSSVNVSPTASGRSRKACHLLGASFLFGVFTSIIHLLLRLQVKHRLEVRGKVLEVKYT